MRNKLIIAAAGSGKTTYLVNKALEVTPESVLILTYTEANENEIKDKIIKKTGCIPSHISIQTWFSFLLKNGVRPFQSIMDDGLHDKDIGFYLSNKKSGHKYGNVYWSEEKFFYRYYFTKSMKIYSDKISKFVYKCNMKSKGQVVDRISRIYKHIFIDEVQDLAGFDLDLIKFLFQTPSQVFLVGDPRQVTYLTHHTTKNRKYGDGKIGDYFRNELGKKIKCEIDEKSLNISHRNVQEICNYSSKLYPNLPIPKACTCKNCRDDSIKHTGVFLIRESEVDSYLEKFKPVQLRWNLKQRCHKEYPVYNFGDAKGLTFDRVLIFPTKDMRKWIRDNSHDLKNKTRAKFYVGLSRARYSSTIIINYKDDEFFDGIEKYPVER